jgi:hypothetical protein
VECRTWNEFPGYVTEVERPQRRLFDGGHGRDEVDAAYQGIDKCGHNRRGRDHLALADALSKQRTMSRRFYRLQGCSSACPRLEVAPFDVERPCELPRLRTRRPPLLESSVRGFTTFSKRVRRFFKHIHNVKATNLKRSRDTVLGQLGCILATSCACHGRLDEEAFQEDVQSQKLPDVHVRLSRRTRAHASFHVCQENEDLSMTEGDVTVRTCKDAALLHYHAKYVCVFIFIYILHRYIRHILPLHIYRTIPKGRPNEISRASLEVK